MGEAQNDAPIGVKTLIGGQVDAYARAVQISALRLAEEIADRVARREDGDSELAQSRCAVAAGIGKELRTLITNLEQDVVGPTAAEEAVLRDLIIEALGDAARTNPCTCGVALWTSCYHPGAPSHEERRADAVMAVLPGGTSRSRA